MNDLPDDWRKTLERACKHLGHKHDNPPNAVVERLLSPFLTRRVKRSRADWRAAMLEAAGIALTSAQVVQIKPAPFAAQRPAKDGFYSSWEWKRLRYEALKAHGQRCQCCGWRPGDTDHGHLVVDHIKPRSLFPALQLEPSNVQVLCNDCNMGKSNVHADDFRAREEWYAALR